MFSEVRRKARIAFDVARSAPRYRDWLCNQFKHLSVSDQPYMSPMQVKIFETMLDGVNSYLEYGSGGSTIMAARHVSHIVSVETDPRFASFMRDILQDTYKDIEILNPDIGPVRDWGIPVQQARTQRNKERAKNYAQAPWKIFNEVGKYPDFILIDGRYRLQSVLESLLSLPDGKDTVFFMDDYTDRPQYHAIEEFVEPVGKFDRAFIFKKSSGFDPEKCQDALEAYAFQWW